MTAAEKPAPPLKCPNGDGVLHTVQAKTRQGAPILIDQCGACGGVWFDRFELFQVDEHDARAIDSIDHAALRYPQGAGNLPLCPRCAVPLAAFHDPNIPANIQLLSCPQCEGFWINHGQLAGYAAFRLERGHRQIDPALAGQYEKVLRSQSDMDYWGGIENWGREMSARRDPLTGLRLDSTDPAQLERIDRAQDIAFVGLKLVAQLLFHWL